LIDSLKTRGYSAQWAIRTVNISDRGR